MNEELVTSRERWSRGVTERRGAAGTNAMCRGAVEPRGRAWEARARGRCECRHQMHARRDTKLRVDRGGPHKKTTSITLFFRNLAPGRPRRLRETVRDCARLRETARDTCETRARLCETVRDCARHVRDWCETVRDWCETVRD